MNKSNLVMPWGEGTIALQKGKAGCVLKMDLSCTMVSMLVLAVNTLILNEAQQRTGYRWFKPTC